MVPDYLKDWPPNFVKHCLTTVEKVEEKDITCSNHEQGRFLVKSLRVKNWQFTNLPVSYRESVFITLDNDDLLMNRQANSIHTQSVNSSRAIEEPHSPNESPPFDQETPYSTPTKVPIPSEQPDSVVKLKKRFHEQLSGLKDVSFLVEDTEVLQEAITTRDLASATCHELKAFFLEVVLKE
ncbi:Hypothetical predicted protein [Paramuricea clavata]|uniref:Uncharacterized protein n=1 Tax=Paramuricea clavata TaxID=317549 RepID=A0A6S7FHZ0_PARCT|nr:Hypothetical predicted protein [Paramuricea clavata]